MNPKDYLESEKHTERKKEYLAGMLQEVPEPGEAHFAIRMNLAFLLNEHLSKSPCHLYMENMKVRVETADAFFYPDILIVCEKKDLSEDYYKSHPVVIVEVLSESNGGFTRGRKFAIYRKLASLREYILIEPTIQSVDCFRLENNSRWVLYPYAEGDEVKLTSLDFTCDVADIYQDV
ncbi:MAG: Uma2 family endonuclease [Gammaproteobacteria bacterium]|nr:Uma2 family endonuclease [Gammaproteobacteria bacterium]